MEESEEREAVAAAEATFNVGRTDGETKEPYTI